MKDVFDIDNINVIFGGKSAQIQEINRKLKEKSVRNKRKHQQKRGEQNKQRR